MTATASTQLLKERLAETTTILLSLAPCKDFQEKCQVLDRLPHVHEVKGLDEEATYVVKALFAIRQKEKLKKISPKLMGQLIEIDRFYSEIGGIIGYQQRVYELLLDRIEPRRDPVTFLPPVGIDISSENGVKTNIIDGLKHLGEMAEVYPVGGAADRLSLRDAVTNESLPAAKLLFGGRELLEGLMRDLQGREFLHYKVFGKQVLTPIVMMTSTAKRGYIHIEEICKKSGWFGRPKESIRLLSQPSVPTVTEEGQWCFDAFKPGGHGAIWKLLSGCFSWLEGLGKKKLLIRQINNPIAGIDYGLLAFSGIGIEKKKKFGFASCPRVVHSHEGMNVIKRRGTSISLSNVEYCDFELSGIEDRPIEDGNTSLYPSNTNILFADIASVKGKAAKDPFPGLILNFRDETSRLESLMQHISDSFAEQFMPPLTYERQLEMNTYLTFNARRKTISTVKREYTHDGNMLETPEGCYFDLLQNMHDLLSNYCGIDVPDLPDTETFLTKGPGFICHYHPALGPLFSIIAQKLRGGKLAERSELALEIAELDVKNIDVSGSLVIHAQNVMGHKDEKGVIHYSNECGKCLLHNVTVRNKGVNWETGSHFWKHGHRRKEALSIEIEGNGEFVAKDVTFEGNHTIYVASGTRVIAKKENGGIVYHTEALLQNAPLWHYNLVDNTITLRSL